MDCLVQTQPEGDEQYNLKELRSPRQDPFSEVRARHVKVHLEGWRTNMLGRHSAGLCVMHSAQMSLSRGSQRCLC